MNPTRGHKQASERSVPGLSHDGFNERPGTVIAVPLTGQPRPPPGLGKAAEPERRGRVDQRQMTGGATVGTSGLSQLEQFDPIPERVGEIPVW